MNKLALLFALLLASCLTAFADGLDVKLLPNPAGAGVYVQLTWMAPSSGPMPTGYNVYRSASVSGPFTRLNAAAVTALTYADMTVVAGQGYVYQATSLCSTCTPTESVPSSQAAITIPPVGPPIITSLIAVKNSKQTRASVIVDWTTPSGTATLASLFNQLTKWSTVWIAPGGEGVLSWSGASPQSPFIFLVCDQTPLCTAVNVQFTVSTSTSVKKALKALKEGSRK